MLDPEIRKMLKKMQADIEGKPRIVYAYFRGQKAPYRFRVTTGGSDRERKLVKGLKLRGARVVVWQPSEPVAVADSMWLELLKWLLGFLGFLMGSCNMDDY